MAFRNAVQGIALGAIIGGSAYGAMRKEALFAQESLIDRVEIIRRDFKTSTNSLIKTERSNVVQQINSMAEERSQKSFEANESVRSLHRIIVNRLKWAL